MADRRPLGTPGRIAELADADRAVLSGIVRTLAGSLTLEDAVSGAQTLAGLVAAGRTATSTAADTVELLTWTVSGANGASIRVFVGNRSPVGNVTGNPGDWYIRDSTTTSALYIHRGASADNSSWVDVFGAAGITGSLGATDNIVPRTVGIGGSTLEASLLSMADDGTLTAAGTSATSSQPAMVVGHSGGTNERLYVYSRDNSPVGNITHNPASGFGVCFDKVNGPWSYFGVSSGSADWYQVAAPRQLYGFALSWTDANNMVVGAGYVSDALGKVHSKATTTALSTTVGLQAPGSLDTGTMTANRWYYVWMIRNNAGAYSFVFSLSQTAPTLSHANFTATAYAAVARVGSFRTSGGAATVVEFYQSGLFNTRRYVNDAAASEMYALSGGTATSQTVIGHSAGTGALPVTAIEAKITVDTNGTSAAFINYSTAKTSNTMGRVSVSATSFPMSIPLLNGTLTYQNASASGSTFVLVHEYTEEVPFS